MKVLDLGFNEPMLEKFSNDEFFSKHKENLIKDFQRLSFNFLDIDLPEDISEAQKASVIIQATDLFTFFIIGHLNQIDSRSEMFKALNETKSKIWLPS